MIVTRVEADKPTIVPPELLAALGLQAGDEIAMERVGNHIVIAAADSRPDMFVNDFSTFTEWDSDEDRRAFDGL